MPYRGTAPALNDLVGGQIDIIVDQASNSMQQIRAGRIRAYAISDAKTARRGAGYSDRRGGGLAGLPHDAVERAVGAEGHAEDIIAKLNAAAVEAMADPAVRKRLNDLGLEVPARDRQTPAALAAWHKAEVEKWHPIIRKAGIKPE